MATTNLSPVLMLMLVGMLVRVLPVTGGHDDEEELDPFDMLNFDHVDMKMRKAPKSKAEDIQPELTKSTDEFVKGDSPATKKDRPEFKSSQGDGKEPPRSDQRPEAEQRADKSCPALSLFQRFVSRLLMLLGDKVSLGDGDAPTELCVRLVLTPLQLGLLESFKREPSGSKVFEASDALTEAVKGVSVLGAQDLRFMWLEERLGVTVEKALQVLSCLVLAVVFLLVLSKIRFTVNFVRWIVCLAFAVSVATTWFRLYKGEEAKQHHAMMKERPSGCSVGDSRLENAYNYFKSYVTFQQDACVEYYEHIIIDPIVKVSIMEACAVAVVQTLLKPMRTVGTEISEFIRALVRDLPVQWQLFSVISVALFTVLVLFLVAGYRVRIPFLLAIEPSPSSESGDTKALKQEITELRATIESIGARESSTQPRLAALPSSSRSSMAALSRPRQEHVDPVYSDQGEHAVPAPSCPALSLSSPENLKMRYPGQERSAVSARSVPQFSPQNLTELHPGRETSAAYSLSSPARPQSSSENLGARQAGGEKSAASSRSLPQSSPENLTMWQPGQEKSVASARFIPQSSPENLTMWQPGQEKRAASDISTQRTPAALARGHDIPETESEVQRLSGQRAPGGAALIQEESAGDSQRGQSRVAWEDPGPVEPRDGQSASGRNANDLLSQQADI